jgi:hypothetical protein
VSKPEKLAPLQGAIEASRDVLSWASAVGFETPSPIIHAEGMLVTVARLNAALMPILRNSEEIIDHFIFHFAGHSIAADAEDQFLLLSSLRSRPDEGGEVCESLGGEYQRQTNEF